MSACVTLDPGVRVTHLPRSFGRVPCGPFRAGHIAFEIVGPRDAPVIAVLGGISAGRRVTGPNGFWSEIVGPSHAIDTRRYRVLGIDYLGGCGQSTRAARRPSSVLPVEQAEALLAVCEDLGIDRFHSVVGASYGGQVALALAALRQIPIEHLVVLCAAHESHPLATALRSTQRAIVRLGQATGRVDEALALARGLAMTSYRSAVEFSERFGRNPRFDADRGRWRFEVEDYLDACGRRFVEAFDADAFLTLSESLDLHRVDPTRIRVPTTIIGFDTDTLVPGWQLRDLSQQIGGHAARVEIDTPFGHDGFLKELAAVGNVLRQAIAAAAATGREEVSA